MIERALHWIAQRLVGPDYIIVPEDEYAGLYRMASHVEPDAMFITDDGEEFEFVMDRTAN